MDSETQFDEVRERAKKTLARLRGVDDDLSTAKTLVEALRNQRDYDLMGQLAEAGVFWRTGPASPMDFGERPCMWTRS